VIYHNILPKLKYFFLIFIFLYFPLCCEKDSCDVVPDTYINISVDLIHLTFGPGQSRIVTNTFAGEPSLGFDNNGIMIYCNAPDEYFAYDRTCPHHIEESIAVEPVLNGMIAKCPECDSEYQLWFSGFPTDASISRCPLKQYRTTFNPNFNTLHIYN
jgi:nitrite reductase/ring-hydroxylating ferredoxin subunit